MGEKLALMCCRTLLCHALVFLTFSNDCTSAAAPSLDIEVPVEGCADCDHADVHQAPGLGRWRVHPRPIPVVSEACREVLQHFSQSVANFSSCLAMSARPITICQDCMNEYLSVIRGFQNISSGAGAECDLELLNRDHLLVVQSLARDAHRFWTTAQCPNCYIQNTDPPRLCNDTLDFFDHVDKVHLCINSTQTIIDSRVEVKNQSEVCERCRDVYVELNKFYEDLSTKYNNRLCMDVMDEMNITRHMWSSTYKCNSLNSEGLTALLSSVGFLLLPVIYYCSNRFVASAKDTKLVPQKRMSFVQSSYSSTSLQR